MYRASLIDCVSIWKRSEAAKQSFNIWVLLIYETIYRVIKILLEGFDQYHLFCYKGFFYGHKKLSNGEEID